MKRGRGYSHWNPGLVDRIKICAELNTPRLFESEKQANKAITGWMSFPNSYTKIYGDDENFYSKSDGRSRNDLEILPVYIRVGKSL